MTYQTALIGIGGQGKAHARLMTELTQEGVLQCIAFAEPNIEANRETADMLVAIGAEHYTDYKEMLADHPRLDFVSICTPIALHKPMSIYAMEKGVHVLTEKPPAVTIQDIDAMIETSKKTGKHCGVFFQNTSPRSFRLMLQKLQENVIGEIKSVTGVGLWHRTDEYYQRTPWAGKLTHNGQYVLDGTINNPLAHLLNNSLIAAGKGDAVAAMPTAVQAELYHGHEIESEDTSCVRIRTRNHVDVFFYATLCHSASRTPYIIVEGSKGRMNWNYKNQLVVSGPDGEDQMYEFDPEPNLRNMYTNFVDVLQHPGTPLYSSIESCRSFVLASNGAFESSKQVYPLPADSWAEIAPLLTRASEEGLLLSELELPWAVRTEPFDLSQYSQFGLYLS